MTGKPEKSKQPKNQSYTVKVNFWGMVQNIIIAGMKQGQLLLVALFILILVFLLKLPSGEMIPFCEKIASTLYNWHYIGWSLFVFVTFSSYYTKKTLRKAFSHEMNRVSEEKRMLQNKHIKTHLASSNNSTNPQ